MAANGTVSLVFTDDVTADRSSRMNSEVHRAIISAAKLIGRCFTGHMEDDTEHTVKGTHDLHEANKWNILKWPNQSSNLNPIEYAFHYLKTKLRAERHTNKQRLKAAAVNAWQSISREETPFGYDHGFRDCQGFSSK